MSQITWRKSCWMFAFAILNADGRPKRRIKLVSTGGALAFHKCLHCWPALSIYREWASARVEIKWVWRMQENWILNWREKFISISNIEKSCGERSMELFLWDAKSYNRKLIYFPHKISSNLPAHLAYALNYKIYANIKLMILCHLRLAIPNIISCIFNFNKYLNNFKFSYLYIFNLNIMHNLFSNYHIMKKGRYSLINR